MIGTIEQATELATRLVKTPEIAANSDHIDKSMSFEMN